jgi:hypothetical protein
VLPWWAPRGFLPGLLAETPVAPVVNETLLGLGFFALPSLLLAAAIFWSTRSALARALAATSLAAVLLFAFYGIASTPRLIWGLFHWRGSLTMSAIALTLGCAAAAPWLATSWLRRSWLLRVILYLPLFFLVVALVRNATGTDPALRFSVSPWPAIPVFGLELGAAGLAVQFAGIAIGLAALARARRSSGMPAIATTAAGIALGIAFPAVSMAIGETAGLLPFRVDAARLASAALVCLMGIAALASLGSGFRDEVLGRRARAVGVAALLLGAPLVMGQVWARADYRATRDERAGPLIEALAAYYEREQLYPESLEQLVDDRLLEAIPEPQIGFAFLGSAPFTYQSFGVGYVLEFSAPRWVQCAYSPPWEEEDVGDTTFAWPGEEGGKPDVAAGDEGEVFGDEEEGEASEGGWTCPSKSPELW